VTPIPTDSKPVIPQETPPVTPPTTNLPST
jgi:hypothetical protein